MMRDLSRPQPDSVDGAAHISEFVRELSLSIIELQKVTPSTLTEENKEVAQHLKTQKRKLYADTMKKLRQMGINSNLSVDTLVKQDGLSTILSSLPLVPEMDNIGRSAEFNLHKVLNIMPQVRAVYKEHSSDLTPNDVTKSIGYIEGLLYVSIRQRSVLSKAAQNFKSIKAPMTLFSNLCQSAEGQISWVSDEQIEKTKSLQPNFRWLAAMLKDWSGYRLRASQAREDQRIKRAGAWNAGVGLPNYKISQIHSTNYRNCPSTFNLNLTESGITRRRPASLIYRPFSKTGSITMPLRGQC